MNATLSKLNLFANNKYNLPLLKGKDIVIIGLQPWYYEIGSNCKNIAEYFAKNNRVLYVNLPLNRKTFLSKEKNKGVQKHFDLIKYKSEKIKQINENMWEFYPPSIIESINWIPSTFAFKAINFINNKRFAKDIRKALTALDFNEFILFNDNDIFNGFNLKELLSPSLYIYYMRDFLQGYDYWKKHCTTLEPELIKKADIVLANSSYYCDYSKQFNKNSFYIGQGCNINLFDINKNYDKPSDMQNISAPVIGYTGYLDSVRLDEKILNLIADAHPEWNIVLVGPQDDYFATSSLHKKSNVHFIGKKNLNHLPAYINSFDVCINPQLKNEITKGNYPLKIDEYLAIGKPVVATRTKAMKLFEEYTYLADEPEDYIKLIEKALAENNEKKIRSRASFARSHTWENSMQALYNAMQHFLLNQTSN